MIRQRNAFNIGKLSNEQIDLFNKVNFELVLESVWVKGYRHAKEYYLANGNLSMKQSYKCSDGYALGIWVFDYRKAYNGQKTRTVITAEQIAALEEIGMDWMNSIEKAWSQGYLRAKDYYETNGDLNVMGSYVSPDGYPLGKWIHTQRKHRNHLTEEKRNMLLAIGVKGFEKLFD